MSMTHIVADDVSTLIVAGVIMIVSFLVWIITIQNIHRLVMADVCDYLTSKYGFESKYNICLCHKMTLMDKMNRMVAESMNNLFYCNMTIKQYRLIDKNNHFNDLEQNPLFYHFEKFLPGVMRVLFAKDL